VEEEAGPEDVVPLQLAEAGRPGGGGVALVPERTPEGLGHVDGARAAWLGLVAEDPDRADHVGLRGLPVQLGAVVGEERLVRGLIAPADAAVVLAVAALAPELVLHVG